MEQPDRLVLENSASLFEGHSDDYVLGNKTLRNYRNPSLMQAMTKLNMVDTLGYGIHRMYVGQARRYFPLPDDDVSQRGTVRLTINGAIADPAYSRILIEKTNLPLDVVFALNRVQEGMPIDDLKLRELRNLLTAMRRAGTIHNTGARANPKWKLGSEPEE